MEYILINYLFDMGETVSEGICFTSQSKVTGLYRLFATDRCLSIASKKIAACKIIIDSRISRLRLKWSFLNIYF